MAEPVRPGAELPEDERRELVELLLREQEEQDRESDPQPASPIPRVPRGGPLRLSLVQERMWVSERLTSAGAGAGLTNAHFRARGPLDVGAFERTLAEIVRRHEILRTVFPGSETTDQVVLAELPPTLPLIDLRAVPDGPRAALVDDLLARHGRIPVDLARGPLVRFSLLRLGDEEHVFAASAHHIVFDGWSAAVMTHEMEQIYAAFREGRPSPLPEPPVQYADFAAWQREEFSGERGRARLRYWTRQLAGQLPTLDLPTDRPRPETRSLAGAALHFELGEELSRGLAQLARGSGATLFMTLLAAFKLCLHRYSGQEEIVIGSPVANRSRVELEGLIGCFMNPLVLRTDLSGNPSFRELLDRVRQVCLGAYAHQEVPFELVVEALRPRWDPSRIPLFQVLFNLLPEGEPRLAGVELSPVRIDSDSSPLDLSLHLSLRDGRIGGHLEYSTELFDAARIARMVARFRALLESVVADPDQRVEALLRQRVADLPWVDVGDLSELSPERLELLRLLLAEERAEDDGSRIVARAGGRSELPLSFGQERLWFFDQLSPGDPIHNETMTLRVEGRIDPLLLERALNEILRRHEVLRTRFTAHEGIPRQVVEPASPLAVRLVDLGALPAPRDGATLERLLAQAARRPFDLGSGRLLRAMLLRDASGRQVLSFTVHHIVTDGRSYGLFVRELIALYEAFAAGHPAPLAPLPLQYADYAVWQRERLRGAPLQRGLAYWRRKLGGELPVLELPTDRPRPASHVPRRGAQLEFALPEALCTRLRQLSRGEGVTLFMTLLAAFQTLLYRYTGQTDLIVDTPIGGRGRSELEGLIGFFVNSLALRTDLAGRPTLRELLRRVRDVCLEAYAHQEIPFDRVVAELQPARHRSGRPLTAASFMLHENVDERWELSGGAALVPLQLEVGDEFELSLYLWEGPERLSGTLKYDAELFDEATARRMIGHLRTLLEAACANPERRVHELPLLTEAEWQELEAWNASARAWPGAGCVHALFEAAAGRDPDAVALVLVADGDDAAHVSYGALDRAADHLARRLGALGVGPGTIVGLCLDRSPELLLGMLAVLKAGGAYLPLDPGYPDDRLQFMLDDAAVPVLLTGRCGVERFTAFRGTVVPLDGPGRGVAPEEPAPAPRATEHDLAYVIYTSGSTGNPKGVLVEHRSVVNHNRAVAAEFALEPGDRVPMLSPVGFDGAVEQIFPTWAAGATVVVPTASLVATGELVRMIEDERLTVYTGATAYWHEWTSEPSPGPPPLRLVAVGGEPASSERLARWQAAVGPRVRWLNTYGPTEATVISTWYEASSGEAGGEPPIGRALPNTRLYVVDAHGAAVPVGVPGELVIGGTGVARGYLGSPALTAERFVPDPFSNEPGARLYRTGDRARYRADGNIEFLGRIDTQLKIRGFRVEPGEIEAALREHPAVEQAVVVALRVGEGNDRRLVGYVVGAGAAAPDAAELHAHLTRRLPPHMVPASFVTLEALPLTASGKIDRRRLPAPDASGPEREADHVAPRTPVEVELARIWSRVLGIDRVGVHDSFFELGGDSILTIRVVARAAEVGLRLTAQQFFQHPTIAELAAVVAAGLPAPPPMQPASGTDRPPLSFAQQRLWFLQQLEPDNPLYTGSANVRLRGRIDVSALRRTLQEIVRRHEVLRTTIETEGGEPKPRITPAAPLRIPVVDLSALDDEAREARAQRIIGDDDDRGFDLARGPLLRVALLRMADEHHVLHLATHHITNDGWSSGIMLREFAAIYDAFTRGQPSPLPELELQYADFARWQRDWLEGEVLEGQLAYWREKLAALPVLDLPTDRPRPAMQTFRAAEIRRPLGEELSARIRQLAREEGATLFMTMLAAFKLLLARHSGAEDIVVGSPVAGRTRPEIEHLIGFFVNTLVLRSDLAGDPSFREVLRRVRKTVEGAFVHQDLPFEKLVEELQPARDPSRTPLFQVFFNMLNLEHLEPDVPGLRAELFLHREPQSKFDLTLYAQDRADAIRLRLSYNADLFEPATVRAMLDDFSELLEQLVAEPERSVSTIRLRRAAAPRVARGPAAVLPPGPFVAFERDEIEQSIAARFEARAERHPQRIALETRGRRWTYTELNRAADAVARAALERLGGDERPLALLFDPGAEAIAALLGALKAGRPYVPLDPLYPAERNRFVITDADAAAILTDRTNLGVARELAGDLPLLDVADLDPAAAGPAPRVATSPDALAYILYTSGSTGRPKGALQNQRNVLQHIRNYTNNLRICADDRLTLLSSYTFDAAIMDIFGALLNGATLCPRNIKEEGIADLAAWLAAQRITIYHSTPTVYRCLFSTADERATFPALRCVVLGGEAVVRRDLELFRRHFSPQCLFVNGFGPTESTVTLQFFADARTEIARNSVPIGDPVEDTEVLLLDREGRPTDLHGEIAIRSRHVALAYRNRPELTRAAFLPDPDRPGVRTYRTGDLARRLPDGSLEFLGRKDSQVKIRGHRVETGEIEKALLELDGVSEASVDVREFHGDERLVAYVVTADGSEPARAELRRELAETLPEHMIPSAFVGLAALPLTPNGKIDRRALPAPDWTRSEPDASFVAPRTDTERRLAEVWSAALGVERVGVHDDFFALGGHSLLATRVVARVREVLGVELPLRRIFEAPTVAELAARIEGAAQGESPAPHDEALQPVSREGELPLSLAQERMWIAEALAAGVGAGLGAGALRLRGALHVRIFERAIDGIVRRHEVLRTAFPSAGGRPVPRIETGDAERLPLIDLRRVPEAERERRARDLAHALAWRPVDLGRGPLFRVALLRLADDDHIAVVSVHHMVFDGWSAGVLAGELLELYAALLEGRPDRLPALPVQYADFAAWQRQWLATDGYRQQLAYWRKALGRELPALELPVDRPAPERRSFQGETRHFRLPAELCRAIDGVGRGHGATRFMTLLASFKALLHRYSGQREIVVGSPVANRTRVETQSLIGCFMNPLVLRTDLSNDPPFTELLDRVREVCLGAYAHQEVPFEKIIEMHRPQWDPRQAPLFQLLFNLLPATDAPRLPGLELEPIDLGRHTSALDMSVHLAPVGDAIEGTVEYSTELFDAATIDGLVESWRILLSAAVAEPATPLSRLSIGDEAPGGTAALERLTPGRRELLELLLAEEEQDESGPAPRGGATEPCPLSFGQERLFFFDRLAPGDPIFNLAMVLRVEGALDARVLEASLREILRRHEVLRTAFVLRDGRPVQLPASDPGLHLAVAELSGLPDGSREAESRRRIDDLVRRPFDLAAPPLLRALLLRQSAERQLVAIGVHHIVADGWSYAIFVRELAELYEAFAAGRPSPLAEPELQYADYAAWQRERLRGLTLQRALGYWKGQLGGELPSLELPADRPRPTGAGPRRGAKISFEVPDAVRRGLRELGRREGATSFMVLLAAYAMLLHRYTGETDILVDSPVAGRDHPRLQGLIGFFVNSLVLRADLSGRPSFRELLARVRRACLDAYAHQEAPLDRVVATLVSRGRHGGGPLTPVSFMLHPAVDEAWELPGGTRLVPLELDTGDEFDLTLYLWEGRERLSGTIDYAPALFDESTIRRMIGHLGVLLREVAADPDRSIAELPLLTDGERQQLLVEWNDTAADLGEPVCVHELFEAEARRQPDAIVAVCPTTDGAAAGEPQLSYGELDRRANALAARLRAAGVAAETRVGICLERSLETLVAVLATLKAGGAYVPLDASYSRQRLELMLEDSGAALLLTTRQVRAGLSEITVPVIELDADAADLPAAARPAPAAGPDNLAYVVYTSGSTGRPKGVMVTHASLVNAYRAWERSYRLRSDATCHLQMASFSFDVFTGDLVRVLCSGARMVICPRDTLLVADRLLALMQRERVDSAEFVPAVVRGLFRHLDESGQTLDFMRLMLVGSDSWYASEYEAIRKRCGPRTRLINSYGVAEVTIDSSFYEAAAGRLEREGLVPIGRPFANSRIYVVDRLLQPLPAGVAGELCLGGPGVARAYLDRPELTAEKFVPDPFGGSPGGRLYRTGDRARLLPDGNVEFLGRVDHQVKIRGFRIEPGEVEAALGEHPGVRQAVVVAPEIAPGERRLVAYVVLRGETQPGDLGEFVARKLPDYMVPQAFVQLEALPLSPSGKVDRRALPALDPSELSGRTEFVAPRTPTEEVLAGIWAEVLELARVGATDDFFGLGGHSLKAGEVMFRVAEAFEVELPLRTLFEAPTVAGLAQAVDTARLAGSGRSLPAPKPVPRDRELPLSYAQEGAWFIDQLQPGVPFNLPLHVRFEGPLDAGLLERALDEVVRRHEVLRTTFAEVEGRPIQVIAPELSVTIPVVDLAALPAERARAEALRGIVRRARLAFDLARGPMLRAAIYRLAVDDNVLLVTVHHSMFDGWSVGVFARELATVYQALRDGRDSPLPPLRVQYADYAIWQRDTLEGELLDSQLAYWRGKLADHPTALRLVADHPESPAQLFRGAVESLPLPAALDAAVRETARRHRVTPFMLLLAAFQALLARYAEQDDIVVGTPVANRSSGEIQDMIGFCVNLLALRTDLSGNPTFDELLRRVQKTCLEAYANQDLPFGTLVRELHPDRFVSRSPLFQVQFALQTARAAGVQVPGLRLGSLADAGEVPAEVRDLVAQATPATDHLFLTMIESDSELTALMQYRSDLFDAATIRRMLGHFHVLLAGLVAEPGRPIREVPLLDDDECASVLAWGAPETVDRPQGSIHRLFEERAARTPDATAVAAAEQALSYGELNRRANRLARHLRGLGIGAESRVALFLERSPDVPVAILGILKAGAAYVPLDPSHPAERLRFLLEDARVGAVVTHEHLDDRLPPVGDALVVRIDAERERLEQLDGDDLPGAAHADHAAYVIYTSGSTGRPKGVVVPHGAVVNHNLAVVERFGLGADDRVLQYHTIGFDAAVEELFPTWLGGGTVVLRDECLVAPDAGWHATIDDERLSVLNLPTAYWREWVRELTDSRAALPPGLRLVIVGGEEPSPEAWRAWSEAAPGVRWINTYGPTEATVIATGYEAQPGERDAGNRARLPIGRPLPNVEIRLLDSHGQPVPIGVAGELCIGGAGLARGYLGRPDLTAERFVPHPDGARPGARLYRTGDLARYRPDGQLEYVGRIDAQIKLRGFRIEPGEIEAALAEHPAVERALVLAADDAGGGKRLVAYLAGPAAEALRAGEVRTFLEARLPPYMVPAVYVTLAALPLSASGKIDRRALPAPPSLRPDLDAEYVAPRTPSELELARIWSAVLGVERVGIHDNFFSLGGHSLMATRLIAQVRRAFDVELPLRVLFDHPTIAGLASAVDQALATGVAPEAAAPDLEAEAVLDPAIAVNGTPFRFVADPERVLLTGATGFVGAFLLRELLQQTSAQVLCLVRARDVEQAAERVKAAQQLYGLWDDASASRIVPLPGDLSRQRLGLGEERFHELAETLDLIYHNGAWVNFAYPYTTLKAANVLGTQEVLRLAAAGRITPVHHVSTISALPAGTDTDGAFLEHDRIEQCEGLRGGYPQTKWVAERLVTIARSRGVPVAIYRPGRVTGDSRTGAWNPEEMGHKVLRTILRLGSVPHLPDEVRLDMVPVNFVARAIVRLSRDERSLGRAFHVVNPAPIPWGEFVASLGALGHPVRELPPLQWARELLRHMRRTPTSLLAPFLPLLPLPLGAGEAEVNEALDAALGLAGEQLARMDDAVETGSIRPVRVDCSNLLDGLRGTAIECPPVDRALLATYLESLTAADDDDPADGAS